MITDIQSAQGELEEKFLGEIPTIDSIAETLYAISPEDALAYITQYSVSSGAAAFERWTELDRYLLVKYIDGNIKYETDGIFEDNGCGQSQMPNQPGYPQWFYDDIVDATGTLHYDPEVDSKRTAKYPSSGRWKKL